MSFGGSLGSAFGSSFGATSVPISGDTPEKMIATDISKTIATASADMVAAGDGVVHGGDQFTIAPTDRPKPWLAQNWPWVVGGVGLAAVVGFMLWGSKKKRGR